MSRDTKLTALVLLLLSIHGVAIFAGFFSPYSYREQNREVPLAAPTKLRWVDRSGAWHLRPSVESPFAGGALVPLRFFVRGSSYSVLGLFGSDLHLYGVDEPHRVFLLGTDALGRDYFSRLVVGAQVSLTAGLVAAALALTTALSLGALAGYFGGWLDAAIMRLVDVFLSLPWIYMLLAARAFLPLDMAPGTAFFVIVVLLGLLGWPAPTRIVRGIVLSARAREYVDASRGAGAGHLHLLRRHILPQAYSAIAIQATLLVPAYMLAEVTLSYVGLGVGEPLPSWGNMLAELPRGSLLVAEPWTFAPAFLLVGVTWLYHSLLSSLGGHHSRGNRGSRLEARG